MDVGNSKHDVRRFAKQIYDHVIGHVRLGSRQLRLRPHRTEVRDLSNPIGVKKDIPAGARMAEEKNEAEARGA